MEIEKLVNAQKAYFATGATIPVSYCLEKLKALKASITAHETDIANALKKDLGKSFHESYMSWSLWPVHWLPAIVVL